MILDDLGLFLHSQGLGVLATTIFQGSIPLDSPETSYSHTLIVLLETPGLAPARVHDGPSASIEQPIIGVRVRGAPDGYEAARVLSEDVYLRLDGLTNITLQGTFYLWILAMEPPFLLQWDTRRRPIFAFRLHCAHARPVPSPLRALPPGPVVALASRHP